MLEADKKDFLEEVGILTIGSRLKRASDKLMNYAKKVYKNARVNFEPKWFPLFSLVSKYPLITLTEAAEMLGQTHSAISQFASQMQKEKILLVKKSEKDERTKILKLTEKGEKLLSDIYPVWKSLLEVMEEVLKENDNNIYQELLSFEKLLDEEQLYYRAMEKIRKKGS